MMMMYATIRKEKVRLHNMDSSPFSRSCCDIEMASIVDGELPCQLVQAESPQEAEAHDGVKNQLHPDLEILKFHLKFMEQPGMDHVEVCASLPYIAKHLLHPCQLLCTL